MRDSTAVWVAAALAGAAFAPAPARAEEPPKERAVESNDESAVAVAVDWRVADGADCLTGPALIAQVSARTARNRIAPADNAEVIIRGRTRQLDAGWAVAIELRRVSDGARLGRRALEAAGSDCHALDESLVLVLAMMVDSGAVTDAGMTAVAAGPNDHGPGAGPRAAEADRASVGRGVAGRLDSRRGAPADSRGPRFALMVAGAARIGQLPGAQPGLALRARLDRPTGSRWWPLELEVAAWREAEAVGGEGSGRARLLTAALAVCPLDADVRGLQAMGCAGLELGLVTARGRDFDENRTERVPWFDIRAEVALRGRVSGPWFAQLGLSAGWAPVRPVLVYESRAGSTEELYRPAALIGGAHAGVGVSF